MASFGLSGLVIDLMNHIHRFIRGRIGCYLAAIKAVLSLQSYNIEIDAEKKIC